MSNTKAMLYDLGVSFASISLWFFPVDGLRLVGYVSSGIFAGDAYIRGIQLISKERRNDEKEAITYEAEVEFYDQLLGSNIEAALEVKALEVENRMLERMIPLVRQKTELERKLQQVSPIHPELSEEEKEEAAKQAINNAFVEKQSSSDRSQQITEEDIRKQFPETMDGTCWKAILKALNNGASKDEIVKDVLGCNSTQEFIGQAYFDLLKRKFL
jgi:hypothetical protein